MSLTIVAILASAFSCPQKIEVQQSAVGIKPEWTVEMSGKQRFLDEGAVFAGRPSLRAKIQGAYAGGVTTWTLVKGEHWAACSYGGSSVTLTRKIDAPAKCIFKRADFVGGTGPATFECSEGK